MSGPDYGAEKKQKIRMDEENGIWTRMFLQMPVETGGRREDQGLGQMPFQVPLENRQSCKAGLRQGHTGHQGPQGCSRCGDLTAGTSEGGTNFMSTVQGSSLQARPQALPGGTTRGHVHRGCHSPVTRTTVRRVMIASVVH